MAELPNAPMDLLHPLALPSAEIDGVEILSEMSGGDAILLWQLLRVVLSWSVDRDSACQTYAKQLERIEQDLLSRGTDSLSAPAALLARLMGHPNGEGHEQVAWACLCISDWALDRGFRTTGIEFARAAGLAWPRNPRYAWVVAQLLHSNGRNDQAHQWFRRAHRVAIWTDDWTCQVKVLLAWGEMLDEMRAHRGAGLLYEKAERVAARRGPREAQRVAALARQAGARRSAASETTGGVQQEGSSTTGS